MTVKMHLPAVVPNEGARRLAAWMVAQPAGTFDRFATRVGGEIMASRLLAGDVRPGRELAYAIYAFTSRVVTMGSWSRQPKGWWFDGAAQHDRKLAA